MEQHTSSRLARPQLETLEGRWQPGGSFFGAHRYLFGDTFHARCDDGHGGHNSRFGGSFFGHRGGFGHGRGHDGHDRHDHSPGRSHHGGWWGQFNRSECGPRRHDNDCHRHHRCDRPNPEPEPTPPPTLGSLSGYVFVDVDGDGMPGDSDERIGGTVIRLSWNDAAGVSHEVETTADANGFYSFQNLEGGIEYTIMEIQPTFYVDGQDYIGSLGGDQSDDNFFVFLEAGAHGQNYNFTEQFAE